MSRSDETGWRKSFMDKLVSREVYRSFRKREGLFSGLGPDAVSTLVSAGSDIALILSPEGTILDVSYRDRAYKAWNPEDWIGRAMQDTVTVESREKVAELLREVATVPLTRSRQVNHPGKGVRDLPVGYRLVAFPGQENRLALGGDMRGMAEMQQRLVRVQAEMDKDYRKMRDVESRYRILFHLAYEPLLVVDAQTLKILDANEGAARLLGRPVRKLVGSTAAGAFVKADQTRAVDAMTAIGLRAREDVFTARAATLDDPLTIRVTPFRESGKTNLLVCFLADDRIGSGLSAVSSMLSIAENLCDGIVVIDDDGRILEANAAFLDQIRVVSFDRVEGKALDRWLGGSSVDLQVLVANLREQGTVRRFSTVIRDELGGSENVDVSASRIPRPDGPIYGLAIREALRADAAHGFDAAVPQAAAQFTDLVGRVPLKDLVRDTSDMIEKLCIEAALRLTENNRASAADMLGLSRQSLYIKLKRYGISDAEDDGD
jgi:transcriptional regulator PpsR